MTNFTYMRWRLGEPRESRVMDPLQPNHPSAASPCFQCGEHLADGRPIQLLAIGPDDSTNKTACREGRWHSTVALIFHAECIGTTLEAAESAAGQPTPKTCDYCGGRTLIVPTATGAMPVDAEPSEHGNVLLINGSVGVLDAGQAAAARANGNQLHIHHRMTCPYSHRWAKSSS